MDKNEIISKIYNDLAGFGSITSTLKEAKAIDKDITYKDIKACKENNTERKTNLRGMNSFIADKPFEEFQMDLFFFRDLKDANDYYGALLTIDIFTKYMAVVPVKSRQITEVLEALKQCIHRMGGKPQTIYSDSEGAFVSGEFQKYFKENNIRHLTTSTHAGVAERAIRTIKNMIYLRVEKNNTAWYDNIYPVVLTYNQKLVSSVTGMTPAQASKPQNHMAVRWNLEKHRRTGRRYPDVAVNDNVKIYKKKDKLDKQQKSLWSADNYKIVNIVDSLGQPFYKLEGKEKLLMRHEILKVN